MEARNYGVDNGLLGQVEMGHGGSGAAYLLGALSLAGASTASSVESGRLHDCLGPHGGDDRNGFASA